MIRAPRIRGFADGSHHGPVRMIRDSYPERAVGDSRALRERARSGQVQNAGDDHGEMPCCTSD